MRAVDFLALFADQERAGFPDLIGSEGQGAIKLSEALLNTVITGQLRDSASIRELHVSPRAGNKFAVRVSDHHDACLASPLALSAHGFDGALGVLMR